MVGDIFMKCELCGREVDATKKIHLDDYALEAQVCASCFDRINGAYLKEVKAPAKVTIEKARNELQYVDEKGQTLPDFVPKFVIKKGEDSHFFGLMQFTRDIAGGKRCYYRALEIYPTSTDHLTHYETSYAFNIFDADTKEDQDQARLQAYQTLKEKMAQLIANNADDESGVVRLSVDDQNHTKIVMNGEEKNLSDMEDVLNPLEGFTISYQIHDSYDPAPLAHTVYFPEVIEEDTFYNELFDIIITFSSLENFIPLDNVQKFALFYRKLLKKFKYFAAIKPDEAALSGFMMFDLLKPLESDDQYFIEVVKKQLQDIMKTL